jgi:uncharacterized protein (DUF3820 family)
MESILEQIRKERIKQNEKWGERRPELIQLAAVIVQWIECLDRNNRQLPKFTDNTPMPFGKYKDKALANVPAEYLLWLLSDNYISDGLLKDYIVENKEQLTKEVIR